MSMGLGWPDEAQKRALMQAAGGQPPGSNNWNQPQEPWAGSSTGGLGGLGGFDAPPQPQMSVYSDYMQPRAPLTADMGNYDAGSKAAMMGGNFNPVPSQFNPGSSQWLDEARGTDQFGGRQQFSLENNFHGSDNAGRGGTGAVSSNASGVPNGVPGQGVNQGVAGFSDPGSMNPGAPASAYGGPTAAQVSASLDMEEAQFGSTPSAPSMASNTTGRSMGMPGTSLGTPSSVTSHSPTGMAFGVPNPSAPATAVASSPVGSIPGAVASPTPGFSPTTYGTTQPSLGTVTSAPVGPISPTAVATAPVGISHPAPPSRPGVTSTPAMALAPGLVSAPAPVQQARPGVTTPSYGVPTGIPDFGSTSSVGGIMAGQVMDGLGLTAGVPGNYGPGAFGLGAVAGINAMGSPVDALGNVVGDPAFGTGMIGASAMAGLGGLGGLGGMGGGGDGGYGGGDANGNMGGGSNDPGGNQGNGPGSSGSQM